jgi:hypothetical protein
MHYNCSCGSSGGVGVESSRARVIRLFHLLRLNEEKIVSAYKHCTLQLLESCGIILGIAKLLKTLLKWLELNSKADKFNCMILLCFQISLCKLLPKFFIGGCRLAIAVVTDCRSFASAITAQSVMPATTSETYKPFLKRWLVTLMSTYAARSGIIDSWSNFSGLRRGANRKVG